MERTYLQYLHSEGLPFPWLNMRSISRALLLFTTGLIMGATCVISSPSTFKPLAGALAGTACDLTGAALDLAGAGVSLSWSLERLETLSKLNVSSLRETGAGASGWAEILVREWGAIAWDVLKTLQSSYI
jgi:hypothetical protein